jgi:chitinase
MAQPAAPARIQQEFRIIGYYKGSPGDVPNYAYEKLTHVIFCFTQLEGNRIAFEDSAGERTLQLLVNEKKKHPGLKVMVSLGGWDGCKTCSTVFATAQNRKAFARSVQQFVQHYGLDGFDLDWESPVIGGHKDHPASPEDKEHFTALMSELRNALPHPLELCFDANSFPEYLHQSIDWQKVMPLVDFVNLMTYGLPNDKSRHTGHHTALYSSGFQKESVTSGILLLDSLKVPRAKVIIGAGFYGFVVKEVDSLNFGLGRMGKMVKTPDYKTIVAQYSQDQGYETHWDSVACAPYLYSRQERTFVTFDNKASCKLKTRYAIDNQLGGLMFWKLNGDAPRDGLLDAIYGEAVSAGSLK